MHSHVNSLQTYCGRFVAHLATSVITTQLAEEDELMWDDGSVNPEPCLDKFDLVTKVCDGEVHIARLRLCTAIFQV